MTRRILVTGARGTVGAELIARLIHQGHAVTAFLRSQGPILRNDGTAIPTVPWNGTWPAPGRVAQVRGDVAEDGLGLDPMVYAGLARTTDLIVHCAAITSFGRSPDRYQAVNFQGTRRMIDFACSRGEPIPLLYVSTAYVCGERPGIFREEDLDLGQGFGNPYETSKFHGERAVREAMGRGLPAVIARPAIIVGDSRTGRIRKFDTLYTVIRVTSAGLVRTLPGDYGATLDIVPVDYVADTLAATVTDFDRLRGGTLHLTSGVPVTLRDVNDVCAEFPSFHVPRYVPRHVFDSRQMAPLEKRYYDEVVGLYESYLRRQIRFDRTNVLTVAPQGPRATGKTLLRRIFTFAVDQGYLAPRAA